MNLISREYVDFSVIKERLKVELGSDIFNSDDLKRFTTTIHYSHQ